MESNVRVKIDAIDNSKGAFASLQLNMGKVADATGSVRKKLDDLRPTFEKMAVVGTASLAVIGSASLKTIKSATNLTESINAVNVVFGEGADNILEFGQNSAKSVGLSTSAFNQMATITGALLKDTGLSMDDVAGKTNELAVRAADMASVFNTDVNDAMSAINQAIRGETEAIRRYAGDVTDASLQTFLLAQGITKATTEMTEQEKRLYRIQLIMAQTAVTAGDFANTSDGLANRQRILSAEIENLSATIGTQLSPVLISVVDVLAPFLERLAQWIQANPELTRNIILVTGAVAGLVAVIGTLSLVLLAFNPVAIMIIATIAGISSIVFAVRNTMQQFGVSWAEIWEGIKNATLSAIDAMLGPLDEIIEKVADALAALAKLPGVKTGLSITKKAFKSVTDLFRADGGPVNRGQGYIVGEKGPEWFQPSANGTIIPNNRLASATGTGGGQTINLYISGTFMDDRTAAKRLSDQIMTDLRTQLRL
ncbi:MAG: phage tail tape measure protein [Sphingopyxis sp.]|nr:phage tail tape measure protein [Sphingopyxis sp.]